MGKIMGIACAIIFMVGCAQKEDINPRYKSLMYAHGSGQTPTNADLCGNNLSGQLLTLDNEVIGSFSLGNDRNSVYLSFRTIKTNYKIRHISMYNGNSSDIPYTVGGNFDFNKFTFSQNTNYLSASYNIKFDYKYSSCFATVAKIEVVELDQNNNVINKFDALMTLNNSSLVDYCLSNCDNIVSNEINNTTKNYFTMNKGEWLSEILSKSSSKSNFVFNNWYPSGLVMGCSHQLTISNEDEMVTVLQSSGSISILYENYSGESLKGYKNNLSSELLTLRLNIDNNKLLNNQFHLLKVNEGQFAGQTVESFYQYANNVFGNCQAEGDINDIFKTLQMINLNFINGNDKGNLVN